jgi:nitroreductase
VTAGAEPVWTAIAGKRAIRDFARRPLDDAHLERILDAGRRAGSSKNQQRWEFVVCAERGHLEELSTCGPWAGHVAGAAVAVALVTPDPRAADAPLSILFDLGQAAANMMLVAWELGIGSVPATVYEHDLVRRSLDLPGSLHCEYILSFGYPSDPGELRRPRRAGGRRSLDDVVHVERWGVRRSR